MDSLISGIIDCVARPSTTDSPVRVIRKTASESPTCVSADPDMAMPVIGTSAAHLVNGDSDSESSSNSFIPPPPSNLHSLSSTSLSRLMVPSEGCTPINSVLTADGVIMGDDTCGTCGDSTACYEANGDDDTISSESIDTSVVRQFEAAFATFLYKNPAFTSMSHTTLQKLRSKLLKESAKNNRAENELRNQLAELRDAQRNRELELQRELLVVTRAKASRETELLIQIQKTRLASMMLDNKVMAAGEAPSATATTNAMVLLSPPASPLIMGSESFEEFQKEMQKNKMDQAHILAEIERIKMRIAEESVTGTP